MKNKNHIPSELLISQIAHDVKNPLASIKAFAQLLERQIKSKKENNYIKKIISEVDDATLLLNNVSMYSKITTNQLQITPNDLNLDDAVNAVIRHVQLASQVILIKEGHSNVIIKTDQEKIKHILLSIISNILKITSNSPIVITLRENIIEIKDERGNVSQDEINKTFEIEKNEKFSIPNFVLAQLLEMLSIKMSIKKWSKGLIFILKLNSVISES